MRSRTMDGIKVTAVLLLVAAISWANAFVLPAGAGKESVSDSHQTRRIVKLENQVGRLKHRVQHRRIKTRMALESQVGRVKREVWGEMDYRTDVLLCMIETLEAEVRGGRPLPCYRR